MSDDPYSEGYRAGKDMDSNENPYPEDSPEWNDYEEGYAIGREES